MRAGEEDEEVNDAVENQLIFAAVFYGQGIERLRVFTTTAKLYAFVKRLQCPARIVNANGQRAGDVMPVISENGIDYIWRYQWKLLEI